MIAFGGNARKLCLPIEVIMSKRGKHRWVHFHRFGGTKPLQWGVAGSLSRMPMTFKCGCVHIIVLGGKHAGMCLLPA
eukprot:4172551-Amphidinium_carterae.1